MYTTIMARCVDQTLQLTNIPKIASGGENVVRVEVTFDGTWDGYGKTAVFHRRGGRVYHVLMVDDACIVPREVLTEPGTLYFSLLGVLGNSTRTAEEVVLTISQGPSTGLSPSEPLPDVYKQVLTAYASLASRVENIVKLDEGSTTGDAELIDARLGEDGVLYSTLGTAIRTQFGYGLLWRTASAYDADQCTDIGIYFAGGSENWTNIPAAAGMLLSFYGNTEHRFYQLFAAYNTTDKVYIRHQHGAGGFTSWTAFATEHDVAAARHSNQYEIRKQSDTSLYIYRPGVNGSIRYHIGRETNAATNLDVWRLIDVQLCGADGTVRKAISTSGADLEGVVLLEGAADHIGGVHGDEIASEYLLFIDGKQYTFNTAPNTYAAEIRLMVKSTLTKVDTANVCMGRVKVLTLDDSGVHIRNEWEVLTPLSIQSVRACMLSVQKDCITHYYDSNVQLFPVEVPENNGSAAISTDRNMVDVYYLGDITARHWAGDRGGDRGKYSTLLHDYGTRLKSYFCCYDGYEAGAGDKLTAENHFIINC